MRIFKSLCIALLAGGIMVSSSCSSMTNTGKGALIGGGGGAALGAGLGAIFGGGKGAAIGSAIGAAVGAGAGTLIGNKMDKQKKELEASLGDKATIDEVTDANGLKAIKVTFPGGILFPTNGTTLNATVKKELTGFAANLLDNPDTNVQIYGFTDNTGSMAANTKVANGRANSVEKFLESSGVAASRLTAEGCPMTDYVASNATAEGRAQNRRVEIYITANEKMIQEAEAGTLK